jgi:hypothetical protein
MRRKNRRNKCHAVGHKLISPYTVHMNCPNLAKFGESNKCIMMLLNNVSSVKIGGMTAAFLLGV